MVEINFIKGVTEKSVPKITMNRSNNGRSGKATFFFREPSILLDKSVSRLKGMFMIDEEGELFTRDVNILISSNKKNSIKAIYSWKTENDFERFIRFTSRYRDFYCTQDSLAKKEQ